MFEAVMFFGLVEILSIAYPARFSDRKIDIFWKLVTRPAQLLGLIGHPFIAAKTTSISQFE
jgi:hypothetical protein